MGDDTIKRAMLEIENEISKLRKAWDALSVLLGPESMTPKPDATTSLARLNHQEALLRVLPDNGPEMMPKQIHERVLACRHEITPNVTRSTLQFLKKATLVENIRDKGWRLTEKGKARKHEAEG